MPGNTIVAFSSLRQYSLLLLGITKNETGVRYTWDDYGTLQWHLVACLAGSWLLICLSLIKGIQSYGKVAYVVTLSPFVVLTILLGLFIKVIYLLFRVNNNRLHNLIGCVTDQFCILNLYDLHICIRYFWALVFL